MIAFQRTGFGLAALALALSCSACISAPEEHLIPSGFIGDVFIVVGQPKGEPPRREGLSRVYLIPSNGILITQDSMSPRWHTTDFSYLGCDGSRTELPLESSTVEDSPANRSDTRPFVWFERDVQHTWACGILEYRQYYVGTRANLLARKSTDDEERFLNFLKESLACS